ncbi:MAG: AAA family ATPase, partial [Thermoleophilaceae bacterium]
MAANAGQPGTTAEEIIGRRDEMVVLQEALDGLEAGRGGCVALIGEPGIGKTRLAAELRARAEERGRHVLEGRGTEFEQDVPFGLAVGALDAYLGDLDPARLRRLGRERLGELGSIFPSQARIGGKLATELPAERYRCHQAVRALLELLARDAPLVLVLDDLHWADHASVELVAHLVRRPPDAPVLLVLAYRPRGASRALVRAVASAEREGSVASVRMSPLRKREASELIGEDLDGVTRRRIYGDSGGNPFYLTELARSARAGGPADPLSLAAPLSSQQDAEAEVPVSVSSAIVEEVEAA